MPLTGGWVTDAVCRGSQAEPGWYPDRATFDADPIVMKYCNQCPVRRKCLEWALAVSEQGVWGGTTEPQRERIKRGISRKACPVCVSVHINRRTGNEICMSCGIAWNIRIP